MALTNAFADLAIETTQEDVRDTLEALLTLLAGIFEKMPKLDAQDRVIIQANESTTAVTLSSGTVTTASNVTNLNNFAGGNTAGVPVHLANVGALHLYNQIIVS